MSSGTHDPGEGWQHLTDIHDIDPELAQRIDEWVAFTPWINPNSKNDIVNVIHHGALIIERSNQTLGTQATASILKVFDQTVSNADLAETFASFARDHFNQLMTPGEVRCAIRVVHALIELEYSPTLENLARAIVERDIASLGSTQLDLAMRSYDLAHILYQTHRFADAVPYARLAVELWDAADTPSDHWTACAHDHLGLVLINSGYENIPEAELHYRRALNLFTEMYGPDSGKVTGVLTNLAYLLSRSHRDDEAKTTYERSIAIQEKHLPPGHPHICPVLNNFAIFHMERHQHREALPLLKRAIEISERAFGPDSKQVADELTNYAACLAEVGNRKEAEETYNRVLDILQKTLGPENMACAHVLGLLGRQQADDGRLPTALKTLERANRIVQAQDSKNSISSEFVFQEYAHVLNKSGLHEQAAQLCNDHLALLESLSVTGPSQIPALMALVRAQLGLKQIDNVIHSMTLMLTIQKDQVRNSEMKPEEFQASVQGFKSAIGKFNLPEDQVQSIIAPFLDLPPSATPQPPPAS